MYRSFKTAPPENYPKFRAWMTRLEAEKLDQWQDLGIYTLLQIPCCGPPYSCGMLLAATQFWEGSTNTFHTKCGMITPTLLDIAAITGLKPTARVFNHRDANPISLKFDIGDSGKPTYNNFIDYHAKTLGLVTPGEHVVFLALWLSCFVFCSMSMQIAK